MGSENQHGEGTSSSLRTFLSTLLTGVAKIFVSSVTQKGQGSEQSTGKAVEQNAGKAPTVSTIAHNIVQDKVEDAMGGVVGRGVLGSMASGVVGAMAGAAAGELADTVLDTATGTVPKTAKDTKGTVESSENACAYMGLGAWIPFDDASESYAHIRQVLRHFEGNTASPYILALGKSSATISTGLDLGQHDAASLRSMGIAEDIITLLEPLLMQDADSARQILREQAVCLSDAQNLAVEKAVILHYVGTTADAYDAAVEQYVSSGSEQHENWEPDKTFVPSRFSMLPKEMQAVMVSVLFQHGSPQAVPRFWSFATQGAWCDVVAELRDFYSAPSVLSVRRNEEADMMLLGMGRIMQGLRVA